MGKKKVAQLSRAESSREDASLVTASGAIGGGRPKIDEKSLESNGPVMARLFSVVFFERCFRSLRVFPLA